MDELKIEVPKESVSSVLFFIAVFSGLIACVLFFSFKSKGVTASEYAEYFDEPLFWILTIVILLGPFLVVIAHHLYRFMTVRRFDRQYHFSDKGVVQIFNANGKMRIIQWDKIGAYIDAPTPILIGLTIFLFHQPPRGLIELLGKHETGSLFSNVLMFIDVSKDDKNTLVSYLTSRGITKKV